MNVSFELKDFASELTELLREFSLLIDTNVFYDDTTYYYKNCNEVVIKDNTNVTDYVSEKCEGIEGLIFVSSPGLYCPCGDKDKDFHDDMMDLVDKYSLSYEVIDDTTFYIYQD